MKIAEQAGKTRRINNPRRRTLDPQTVERHASWLELFFDLVYVLSVSRVAQISIDRSDLHGFLTYVALFVPVWWSWVGFTFYADRFESDETVYRVLTFAGMLAVPAIFLMLFSAAVWLETIYKPERSELEEKPVLEPCGHAPQMKTFRARSGDGCEECRKNNYKWALPDGRSGRLLRFVGAQARD